MSAGKCASHHAHPEVAGAIASGKVLGGYASCARCTTGYLIGSDADGDFEMEPGTGAMRKRSRSRVRVHYATEIMEKGGMSGDAWCYPGDQVATNGSDWIRIISVDQEPR